MIILTAVQARYTGFSPKNSEEFNSASRSIKPGLIASGIVSAWTWAATLVRITECRSLIYLIDPFRFSSCKVVQSLTSSASLVPGGMAVSRVSFTHREPVSHSVEQLVRPSRFCSSPCWLPNSNSTLPMLTLGLRSSEPGGDDWPMVSSCSSGMPCSISQYVSPS